jgi:hypothetical protein
MANFEYKQAILKLAFEGGLTDKGTMKTKAKSYRNVQASATPTGLDVAATTLANFSSAPYIGAEKIETSTII